MQPVGADQHAAFRRLAVGEFELDLVAVLLEAHAEVIEVDRIRVQALHALHQRRVQVAAVKHEHRHPVALADRRAVPLEKRPRLAGVPGADFLVHDVDASFADGFLGARSKRTRVPFAEICTPAPISPRDGACS
mgnify:CR=1 FL=1